MKAISGQLYNATAVTNPQISGHPVAGLPSGSNGPMLNHGGNPASIDTAVRLVMNERSRCLELDKKETEIAGKAEQRAKNEAAQAQAEATPDSRHAKQLNYAQIQKKRQLDEQQERERILRVIENDKLERKHNQDMLKAHSQAKSETNDELPTLDNRQVSGAFILPMATSSNRCAIQVRLFDGSSIRSSFHSNETLGTSVRRWVDQNRTDGATPYNFKQIMTPMPSRYLTVSEEVESLMSLGLIPSATLILVPIREYVVAYDRSEGYLSSGVLAGYHLIHRGLSWISGAVISFVRTAQNLSQLTQAAPATLQGIDDRHMGPRNGINFRTVRDRHTSIDEQQFYNGNQVKVTCPNLPIFI